MGSALLPGGLCLLLWKARAEAPVSVAAGEARVRVGGAAGTEATGEDAVAIVHTQVGGLGGLLRRQLCRKV